MTCLERLRNRCLETSSNLIIYLPEAADTSWIRLESFLALGNTKVVVDVESVFAFVCARFICLFVDVLFQCLSVIFEA